MKDFLDFIAENKVWIALFFILFGGGIGSFLYNIVNRRHQRKMAEMQYRYRLQILAERRQIAETEGDAIKLLIADEALGEDFDRRLRVALDHARKATPPKLAVMRDPEIDEEDAVLAEEESAAVASKPRKNRARRRP